MPPADGLPALAERLAAHVYLSTSPDVPLSAVDYWGLSFTAYRRVHARVGELVAGVPEAEKILQELEREPGDVAAHRALTAQLVRLLQEQPDLATEAAALVASADEQIWIDYWLGSAHAVDRQPQSYDRARIEALPRPAVPEPAATGSEPPRIHVVIPFRDPDLGPRTRNLLACLRSLRDQDPAGGVLVTVVETDLAPRVETLVGPYTDRYVFAHKDGRFNKSWAVNVGLRAGGPPGAPGTPVLTCVLDADILVERDYLASNADRIELGSHEAHLTYQRMFSMDAASTDLAIHRRLVDGAPTVGMELLRGLLLRDTPGGSLWARTEVLHRIGGFDERFEGWGGEDDDVIARLTRQASFTVFGDPLLHLNHPRPAMTHDDGRALNGHLLDQHLGAGAWTGAEGYGDADRFAPRAPAPGRAQSAGSPG
ncbi:galactosyltransferase-related protein [Streptacidiphilus sp. PAMC 29251]